MDDYYFRMFIVIHKYPFSVSFCTLHLHFSCMHTFTVAFTKLKNATLGFVYHCTRLALWEIVNCCTYALLFHCWVWWYRLCKSLKYLLLTFIARNERQETEKWFFFVINFDCCCALKFFFYWTKNLFIHIDIRQISRTNYVCNWKRVNFLFHNVVGGALGKL